LHCSKVHKLGQYGATKRPKHAIYAIYRCVNDEFRAGVIGSDCFEGDAGAGCVMAAAQACGRHDNRRDPVILGFERGA